jgi:hypothetical protein
VSKGVQLIRRWQRASIAYNRDCNTRLLEEADKKRLRLAQRASEASAAMLAHLSKQLGPSRLC